MAEKLSITLPEDMVGTIKGVVASGAYASTSEVLREAMRLWLKREEEHTERMNAIRARIHKSVSDPRSHLTGKDIRQNLDALYGRNRAQE
jgi:antitoxin ParD1/3/4